MIRNFTPILTLAFITSLGCQVSQSPAISDTFTSPTLTQAMGPILAEALTVRRAAGDPLPEDAHTPEYLVEVLNLIRLQYPDALSVNAPQEELLAAGEFDDATNERLLLAAIRILNRDQLNPKTFTGYLVEQYKAAGLNGARLEIASRLLDEQLKINELEIER